MPSSAADAGATTGAGAAGAAGATGTSGTTGATGTSGTATDAASAQKFVLTNATSSSAETANSAATSGTTAAEPSASGSATYRLIANPAALSPHVGKKLELTGTIENGNSANSSSAAAGPEANAPALRVESGKIVAASCTQ